MTTIEKQNDVIENIASTVPDEKVADIDFSNVKVVGPGDGDKSGKGKETKEKKVIEPKRFDQSYKGRVGRLNSPEESLTFNVAQKKINDTFQNIAAPILQSSINLKEEYAKKYPALKKTLDNIKKHILENMGEFDLCKFVKFTGDSIKCNLNEYAFECFFDTLTNISEAFTLATGFTTNKTLAKNMRTKDPAIESEIPSVGISREETIYMVESIMTNSIDSLEKQGFKVYGDTKGNIDSFFNPKSYYMQKVVEKHIEGIKEITQKK